MIPYQNAIEIEDLHKSYGRVQALRGIDLTIRHGEVFGFLGPNGAGKTTAIRCLLDLIRPDSGRVRVLGFDPQKQATALRERTGYLPGELNLEGSRKVNDQLRYLAALRGNRTDWREVHRLAERLDLDLEKSIKNLSKGNKQKVGIIQALMHAPDLLILDEPTSGLDPLMQQEVLRLIKEANTRGATIFFSSHIISEVEHVADRVAIIRRGKVVQVASPESLVAMQMRRLRVTFNQQVDRSIFDGISGVEVLPGDEQQVLRLQVSGEIGTVLKALAACEVRDMEIERHTLEEIFMAFYHEDEGEKVNVD